MIEADIIAACKAEMFKRFPRDKIVIGRPSSTSQYDTPYVTYGLIVQQTTEGLQRGSPAGDYTEDAKRALVAATGAWFDDLREHGTVLVVRRALEFSKELKPIDYLGFLCRFKITFRAHAANEIMLYTPDYAERRGDTAKNVELDGYMEDMRKALA